MSTWDNGQQPDTTRPGWRLRLAQHGQREEPSPLNDVNLLTVAEVALIMRVSKMTVYRLVHSRELEAIRVGRSFRIPEDAVNAYLRAGFVRTA